MQNNVKKYLESRMLRKLHVRFGVGVGVQTPDLHHDVIVQRWEEFTGNKAQRISASEKTPATSAEVEEVKV